MPNATDTIPVPFLLRTLGYYARMMLIVAQHRWPGVEPRGHRRAIDPLRALAPLPTEMRGSV
jgi:hypothetical protein